MPRARPPRPASIAIPRPPGPLLVAALLALALLTATTLGFAGTSPAFADERPGERPGHPGLAAVTTTLWLTSSVHAASLPSNSERPLIATGLRSAPRAPARAARAALRPPRVRRTRAQRWYARRNLDGG